MQEGVFGITAILRKTFALKYKKGYSISDYSTSRMNIRVFIKIFFRLLELMLLDVAEGHTVILDKKLNSQFFVVMRNVPTHFSDTFKGGITKIDLKKSKYMLPHFAFSPGDNHSPALVRAPKMIWSYLIEQVNAGKKYVTPTVPKFYFQKTDEENAAHAKLHADIIKNQQDKYNKIKDI